MDNNKLKLTNSSNVIFHFEADFNFEIIKETAFISKAYGLKMEGYVVRIKFIGECSKEFRTIIKKEK